jgi:hypothetical protein
MLLPRAQRISVFVAAARRQLHVGADLEVPLDSGHAKM